MIFDITFRNPQTGAKETLRIQADSKAAVWPILKERGITPVSIEEAKGSPVKMPGTGVVSSARLRVLVAVLAVAVAALVAVVLLPSGTVGVRAGRKAEKSVAEVRHTAVVHGQQGSRNVDKPASDEAAAGQVHAGRTETMTPGQRMQFLLEEAAKKPVDMTPPPERAFKTGTEQLMSWIFTTELGAMPPPLPRIPVHDEVHMAEILTAPNPALEGDSESAKNAKAMVELAKKELIRYIDEGGSVDEFFSYYHGELVKAHNQWIAVQKSAIKVIHEEPELAADYIREANASLAEKGIRPVMIPPKLKEDLGIVD